MSEEIKWPQGYVPLRKKIRSNRDVILNGTLLAIDPSSFGKDSVPGFTIYEGGKLLTSGTIQRPPGPQRDTYQRIQFLYERVSKLLPIPPDVLVLEEIHKALGPVPLLWAAGVSIAAANAPVTIECPINLWKCVAKATPGYIKGDAMDSECMARAIVLLAQQS